MKEFENGLKVIGTDLGYGNIKTVNTVTPTGISVYDTEPIFHDKLISGKSRQCSVLSNSDKVMSELILRIHKMIWRRRK